MSTVPAGSVLVVMPTYDEAENLEPITGRLRAALPGAQLLIVDDDSPDGTGRLADRLSAADPRVHVVHRTVKRGLGSAYVAGFGWAAQRGFDVVVEMDADGSHAPEDLPRLLAALRSGPAGGPDGADPGADLVLGSRWVDGGTVRNWPRSRLLLSRGGNAYVRFALGLPLKDATGGFRAYRRQVLEAIPLDEVASTGYCFQVDLAWRAWMSGFRVVEVPITFTERERGRSKMSRAIVIEALWRVTYWGLRSRVRRLRRGPKPRGAR